jgi:hypothetical protein
MAIRTPEDVAGVLEADVLEAGVLEADVLVDVLEDEEVLDDEQPLISAAITAIATPHAAKRARPSVDMILALSFREKGRASRSTCIFDRLG